MSVSQLEVWHLVALVVGSLLAGNGLTAGLQKAFDAIKSKWFTPEPGPSQKELLNGLLAAVAGLNSKVAAIAPEASPASVPAVVVTPPPK